MKTKKYDDNNMNTVSCVQETGSFSGNGNFQFESDRQQHNVHNAIEVAVEQLTNSNNSSHEALVQSITDTSATDYELVGQLASILKSNKRSLDRLTTLKHRVDPDQKRYCRGCGRQ